MQISRRAMASMALVLVVAGAGLGPCAASAAEAKAPVVFAAASMKNALDAVNAAWKKKTGFSALISYAASSSLAKQIAQGAPADIYVSADLDWMDYLAKRHLIDPRTRVDLLGNALVLVVPKESSATKVDIASNFPLSRLLGQGKLAMANVDSVPAGKYGKEALISLHVWDSVKADIAQAQNVRAALALVARGEAPFGIVYRTDAVAEPNVKIVGTFPEASHAPIIYPVAELAAAKTPEASDFLAFMTSDAAKPLFEAQGFSVLNAGK
jgi:molybdate transport system substrate-binding protein